MHVNETKKSAVLHLNATVGDFPHLNEISLQGQGVTDFNSVNT